MKMLNMGNSFTDFCQSSELFLKGGSSLWSDIRQTRRNSGENTLAKLCVCVSMYVFLCFLDLPGPLCYKTSCRFNCILYIGPNSTGSDK